MDTKQVIVVRRDLNLRKGKLAAQASHAAMMFLSETLDWDGNSGGYVATGQFSSEEADWFRGSFAKVVVGVNDETELLALAELAKSRGLTCHVVTDEGRTLFDGVKTRTCLAIGPHEVSKFEGVTDGLKLL